MRGGHRRRQVRSLGRYCWHWDYSPTAWKNRATEEQKRIGWEMAVRIEKIICTVIHEAHKRQVEEAMNTLSEDSDNFYKGYLDCDSTRLPSHTASEYLFFWTK